jgi:hypothetical protein
MQPEVLASDTDGMLMFELVITNSYLLAMTRRRNVLVHAESPEDRRWRELGLPGFSPPQASYPPWMPSLLADHLGQATSQNGWNFPIYPNDCA